MIGLPLGFAQPLVLLGLLSLPVLWWLLRLIPPRPRRIDFPPTRLLFDIKPKEETPARTPWWLTLLRLDARRAGHPRRRRAVVESAAGDARTGRAAAGPDRRRLGAAATWDARLRTADEIIARAEADNRGVALVPLSGPARDISLQTAGAARVQVKQLKPKPYAVDRSEALPLIERFLAATPNVEIVWLSDGIDLGKGCRIRRRPAARHRQPSAHRGRRRPADRACARRRRQRRRRADRQGAARANRRRRGRPGHRDRPQGSAARRGAASPSRRTTAKPKPTIDLPVEIRNDVARLEIAGERSAGAVQLLDKRWRRRTVGVVSGSAADRSQPLLGASYYLSRALAPFADVRLGRRRRRRPTRSRRFLDQHLPMMILADVGNVAEARDRLDHLDRQWRRAGALCRPASCRRTDDDLVPVKLRRGGRILGGSLSWDKPQQLAAFSREGPFAGMTVPNDVTVNRQVLAEPDARAFRPHLGDARRRHAAGHRRSAAARE